MKKYNMKLVGGFVGTAMKKTKEGKVALRPAIGWLMFYSTEQELVTDAEIMIERL